MNNEFLLSLCIPTYNRAFYLEASLERLRKEFEMLDTPHCLELIVSDNCSTDSTQEIVEKYIVSGFPIRYIRNKENLGMDGNFVQCVRQARGKYVWIVGDDDYLKEGVLKKIISLLASTNYGMVHLQINGFQQQDTTLYSDPLAFISDVSYWTTFISANIVRTQYAAHIDFEKYMGTYFTMIPLYLTAALAEGTNLMIHDPCLEIGADKKRNGGYNIFQVFIVNYLSIWKSFMPRGIRGRLLYEKEKRRLYRYFLLDFIYLIYLCGEKGNFKISDGKKILFKYYGMYPYTYYLAILFLIRKIIGRACKVLKKNK